MQVSDLNDHFPEWEQFQHFFQRKEVPAKTILLQEGEIAKRIFYLEKGCLRVWFNHLGKDITFQFFFEGEGVSSIESFRTNQPSLYTIETLEPCTILTATKKDFETIMARSPAIRQSIEEHIFQRLIYYQKLFLSRIKDSPHKRYEELIIHQPKILQRVPQHYIASYLGVTPVSLSRIRNRK